MSTPSFELVDVEDVRVRAYKAERGESYYTPAVTGHYSLIREAAKPSEAEDITGRGVNLR